MDGLPAAEASLDEHPTHRNSSPPLTWRNDVAFSQLRSALADYQSHTLPSPVPAFLSDQCHL
ncbi:hypothetical protein P280DRAFT_471247 [Massarina eburnea CBS 473.64]|uniref:Uncharacterized protein n=1 Tax=Massarina eburnea CBS 473.64 TaxID=1395130 RepID=A0A6A6RU72_9PLEO|nr:hypothetical protein P280DRAFT_471247 [Massarina eburnea CBS 473.64]